MGRKNKSQYVDLEVRETGKEMRSKISEVGLAIATLKQKGMLCGANLLTCSGTRKRARRAEGLNFLPQTGPPGFFRLHNLDSYTAQHTV
ncbi:hypothetical protein PoB_003783600 [Plakobranchus ocellatus]|uniref:Uncharacterized protein n=1 Tax=Plakobranchus ocellatus TaxID=259542 RepID=A0AAV4AT73_9GAST|nr:hypothetical protein PoB_003783600 [Plakobranchus ocellatus]